MYVVGARDEQRGGGSTLVDKKDQGVVSLRYVESSHLARQHILCHTHHVQTRRFYIPYWQKYLQVAHGFSDIISFRALCATALGGTSRDRC